jgi:hypothetical protein
MNRISRRIIGDHKPFEMDPDQLAEECRELINIIAAEFESDPMSVQCFDLRIVERAKRAARIHRRYKDGLSEFGL